jgi:hypothetical protein
MALLEAQAASLSWRHPAHRGCHLSELLAKAFQAAQQAL